MALFRELRARVTEVQETATATESTLLPRPAYGNAAYWEERYAGAETTTFEWLITWLDIAEIIIPYLRECGAADPSARLLHVGCGNSTLGTDVRLAGFGSAFFLNTDIAPTVIRQMQDRFPQCNYEVDDALDMKQARSHPPFHAVIDKGTLDAFACIEDIQEKKASIVKYLGEVYQVLTDNGILIVVSFGQRQTRLQYFGPLWSLVGDVREVRGGLLESKKYYVYVLRRV
jgi:hypothetical protein